VSVLCMVLALVLAVLGVVVPGWPGLGCALAALLPLAVLARRARHRR